MKYVYLLRAGDNHYKVGIALNVTKRMSGVQTGNPLQIELICARLTDNAEAAERVIHESLHERKLNGGSEWFELTPTQALDLAAMINNTSEVDITKQLTINSVIAEQLINQKKIEKKLDMVINDYANLRKERDRFLAVKIAPKPAKDKPSDNELYERAIEIAQSTGKASTSLLQRKLKIGYGRAARLIEMMEERGIVGPLDGIRRELLKAK